MSAILLTGPAVEPVSLAEARAYLRIDGDAEDLLVQSLITAARLHTETLTARAMISQSWRVIMDGWPRGHILDLPIGPVQTVTELRVFEDDDIVAVIDPSRYLVETAGVPARIAMRARQGWPRPGRALGGIEIDLDAGYGPEPGDVPGPLRQAVLQLVAHWYERREPVSLDGNPLPVPAMADALMRPFMAARL